MSPLRAARGTGAFVRDGARVRRDIDLPELPIPGLPDSFEKAGPRERIYFEPGTTTAAILSAGGLCPGINDVVRAAVLELRHGYGVQRVLGIRHGFAGLDPARARAPLLLTLEAVRDVHHRSGSILGTSRGPHDPDVMVETLRGHGIAALIAIGGDGTMRAAHAIHSAARARGWPLAVVGLPKTIDDDVPFVDKTFGFDTAVSVARAAIEAAHAEARSVENGIGLVKLMGRRSGFIAAQATLASGDVNVCLVPEVPFTVDRLLAFLERRLAERGHAVVVAAEGCEDQLDSRRMLDESGNPRYSADERDVGKALRSAIVAHFENRRIAMTLKYIDPSYMLRGVRVTSDDAVFCDALGRHAVHAAMAGKSDIMIGRWNRRFTHVPLTLVNAHEKRIEPRGELWHDVVESTGQPPLDAISSDEASSRASR